MYTTGWCVFDIFTNHQQCDLKQTTEFRSAHGSRFSYFISLCNTTSGLALHSRILFICLCACAVYMLLILTLRVDCLLYRRSALCYPELSLACRDFPPVLFNVHQKLHHCQRCVPGSPAGGNLLPSPSTVKELIVLGRQDTVNMRAESVSGDTETHAETSDRQTHSPFWEDMRHTQAHKQIPEIEQGHEAWVSPSSAPCVLLPRSPDININNCRHQQVNWGDCSGLIFPRQK